MVNPSHPYSALIAHNVALQGDPISRAKFREYFKTNSYEALAQVAEVYQDMWQECENTTNGWTQHRCVDDQDLCSKKPLVAFAYKETRVICYCPMWFDKWVENVLPCH